MDMYLFDPDFKPEDLHFSSSFHLPSPYIHYEDDSIFRQHLQELLHQQQPENNIVAEAVTEMANSSNSLKEESNKKCGYAADEAIPRKRSSKKDRHSKINTAHGPRDRRMRLSLEVARKFFGLQDMLGFDKASRTVEWLLKSSKTAIKELARGFPHSSVGAAANSASSTSECEVLSGIDESVVQGNQQPKPCCTKEKKVRGFRRVAFDPLAKESREKARARARERTREKRRLVESNLRGVESMNRELNRLGCCWSPFAAREEESVTQSHSAEVLARERQDIVADSLLITGNWSPSTVFNYQNNNNNNNNNNYAGISHEHQFTDFCGKPWEAYNN